MPRLCGLNPGICLTTEEKARGDLNQHATNIHTPKNYEEYANVDK
jgi:hypothetical protein